MSSTGGAPRRRIIIETDPGRWPGVGRITTEPSPVTSNEWLNGARSESVVILPTPDHLPGSVSMMVRRRGAPPVLLIGDLSYSEELIGRDQFPATGEKELLAESFAKVRELKRHLPDLVVVASHDAGAADKLAAAGAQRSARG